MADTDLEYTALPTTPDTVAGDEVLIVRGGAPMRFTGTLPTENGLDDAVAAAQAARDEALAYGGATVKATWAEAAALTGLANGATVTVVSADTGTHASVTGDYGASGGNTPNAGVFRYSTSLSALVRIANLESAAAQAAASDSAAANASAQAAASLLSVYFSPGPTGAGLEVLDKRGTVIATLTSGGLSLAGALTTPKATVAAASVEAASITRQIDMGGNSLALGGANGGFTDRRAVRLTRVASDGYLETVGVRTPDGTVDASVKYGATILPELMLLNVFGQSNSIRQFAARTSNLAHGLRFSAAGAATASKTAPSDRASLVPLTHEYQPGGAISETLYARVGAGLSPVTDANNFRTLVTHTGYGGDPMWDLQKVITPEALAGPRSQMGLDLDAAISFATSNGWRLSVPALVYSQGESESNGTLPDSPNVNNNGAVSLYGQGKSLTGDDAYARGLERIRSTYETLVKGKIPSQTRSIPLIINQIASHQHALVAPVQAAANAYLPYVALGQYKAAATNPLIFLSCPTYMAVFADNQEHYDERWAAIIGGYHALAYEQVALRGKPWKMIKLVETARDGKTAWFRYDVPYGGLVFDTSWVSDPGNYGFQIYDSPTGSEITQSAAPVVLNGNTVKITCSSAIPAGAQMRYAWKFDPPTGGADPTAGHLTGARGCLRDRAGDAFTIPVHDGLGDWAAHNYAPIHASTLA